MFLCVSVLWVHRATEIRARKHQQCGRPWAPPRQSPHAARAPIPDAVNRGGGGSDGAQGQRERQQAGGHERGATVHGAGVRRRSAVRAHSTYHVLTLSRALVQATCAIRFYNVCHRSRAHLLSPRKERNMLKWVKHPPPFGQTPGRSHFTTRLTGGNGRWGGQSQLASHKPGERWGLARAPCVSLCKMQLASCKQLAQPTAVSD